MLYQKAASRARDCSMFNTQIHVFKLTSQLKLPFLFVLCELSELFHRIMCGRCLSIRMLPASLSEVSSRSSGFISHAFSCDPMRVSGIPLEPGCLLCQFPCRIIFLKRKRAGGEKGPSPPGDKNSCPRLAGVGEGTLKPHEGSVSVATVVVLGIVVSGDQLSAGINQFAIATRTKKTWECRIFWGAGFFVVLARSRR
jgi:hypothetical protein